MTNLDRVLNNKGIILPAKVWHIVKAIIFLVVMYRCKSWTMKTEHRIIDAFKLWYWRKLLRVPWTARRSNQSILKEINLEYSLEGLILKLKLQYFVTLCKELTYWKRPWCWERLKAGGERGDRGWDGWMASLTQWTWVWGNSRDSEGQGSLAFAVHGVSESWTRLSSWLTTTAKQFNEGKNSIFRKWFWKIYRYSFRRM